MLAFSAGKHDHITAVARSCFAALREIQSVRRALALPCLTDTDPRSRGL